jgi:hypothetical protein
MEQKKKPLSHNLGDDSGEMDVIKDIFAGDEPTGGTTDIFASDIFAIDPFAPAPAKAPEPKPEPKPQAKPPALAPAKTQPAPAKAAPAPAKTQPAPKGIKVVTDADFKQLLDVSPAPLPAKPKPAAPAKPAPAPAAAKPKPAPAPAKPAPAPAVEPESLEFQAVAEDLVAVSAAKKGAALEQIAHELEDLEPMGDDFMSIEEMKKLFGNVNAMMEAIQRLCQRIDRLEEALAKAGLLKPEKK